MVATDRTIKLADILIEKNYDVILITVPFNNIQSKFVDNKQYTDFEKRVNIMRVPFKKGTEPNFLVTNKSWFCKMFTGLLWRIYSDIGYGWNQNLLTKLNEIISQNRIDLIIATGGPFLSFIPVSDIAIKYKIPYILDYRDTWSETTHKFFGQTSYIPRLLERKVNKYALSISTVSEGCLKSLQKTCDSNKVKVLYNFPSRKYSNQLKTNSENIKLGEHIRIVFTGSMYEGRTFRPVLKAFKLLDTKVQVKFLFIYCGANEAFVNNIFEEFNLLPYLINLGMLNKQEAWSIINSSDVCLNVVYDDTEAKDESIKGIITTKIFDYLGLNKICLNICPVGNELYSIKDKFKLSNLYNFNGGDMHGIANFLTSISEGKVKAQQQEDTLSWEKQDFSWIP